MASILINISKLKLSDWLRNLQFKTNEMMESEVSSDILFELEKLSTIRIKLIQAFHNKNISKEVYYRSLNNINTLFGQLLIELKDKIKKGM